MNKFLNVTELPLNEIEDLCLALISLSYALSNHCDINPDIFQMELIESRADRLRELLGSPYPERIQEEETPLS